jgi:hypothetical protein
MGAVDSHLATPATDGSAHCATAAPTHAASLTPNSVVTIPTVGAKPSTVHVAKSGYLHEVAWSQDSNKTVLALIMQDWHHQASLERLVGEILNKTPLSTNNKVGTVPISDENAALSTGRAARIDKRQRQPHSVRKAHKALRALTAIDLQMTITKPTRPTCRIVQTARLSQPADRAKSYLNHRYDFYGGSRHQSNCKR